jgi:hypothetical protein
VEVHENENENENEHEHEHEHVDAHVARPTWRWTNFGAQPVRVLLDVLEDEPVAL